MVDLGTYQKMHKKAQPLRQSSEQGSEHAGDERLSQAIMDAEEPPGGNFIFLLPQIVSGFNMQAKQWGE